MSGLIDKTDVADKCHIEQGKFVIGVDCKRCGTRHYGKSYTSVEAAYYEALSDSVRCTCNKASR